MSPDAPAIVRRNNHYGIGFEVDCEQTNQGVRVTVAPLVQGASLLPCRRQPFSGRGQVSEHPTLRVFDEFLADPEGKVSHIGKVTHLCVRDDSGAAPWHLLSIVETKTNVSLFPAWGTGPMKPLKSHAQLSQPTTVGHVTWNKFGEQRHLHLSGGARAGGKKERVGGSVRLQDPDESGLHAARLTVQSLDTLDPLALPFVVVPPEAWGFRNVADVQRGMTAALSPHSFVDILPAEWDLASEVHIEACIGMKEGPFGNDPFARPDRELPQASPVEQVLKVPLTDSWNMIVQLRLINGKAPRAFGWSPG